MYLLIRLLVSFVFLSVNLFSLDYCGNGTEVVSAGKDISLWINGNTFVNGSDRGYSYFNEFSKDGNSGVGALTLALLHNLDKGHVGEEDILKLLDEVIKHAGELDARVAEGVELLKGLLGKELSAEYFIYGSEDRDGCYLKVIQAVRLLGSYLIHKQTGNALRACEFYKMFKEAHSRDISLIAKTLGVRAYILDNDHFMIRNFDTLKEKYSTHIEKPEKGYCPDIRKDIVIYPYQGQYYVISSTRMGFVAEYMKLLSGKPETSVGEVKSVHQKIPLFLKDCEINIEKMLDLDKLRRGICGNYIPEDFEAFLDKESSTYGLGVAVSEKKTGLINYFIEKGGSLDSKYIIGLLVESQDYRLAKFLLNKGGKDSDTFLRHLLISKNHALVRLGLKHLPNKDEAQLIGLANYYGNWTDGIIRVLNKMIEGREDAYIVSLTPEIVDDEHIMKKFSGLVNPGAPDTYPKHKDRIKKEDVDALNSYDQETLYQDILEYVDKYEIPYLGICAGSQHLVLNKGGTIEPVTGHKASHAKITFYPGTIPHYMALAKEEQERAIKYCEMSELEVENAKVNHGFAAVKNDLGGKLILAGLSDKGVPQAYYMGGNKIGIQFHPERFYFKETEGVNRQKQILDSYYDMVDQYHKTWQSAKAKGTSREEFVRSLREAHEALLGRLKRCKRSLEEKRLEEQEVPAGFIQKYFPYFYGIFGKWATGYQKEVEFDSNIKLSESYLWGRNIGNHAVKLPEGDKGVVIKLLPGITPNDIAMGREEMDLTLINKATSERLIIKDYFDPGQSHKLTSIDFADGTKVIPPIVDGEGNASVAPQVCADIEVFTSVYDNAKEGYVLERQGT